MTVLLKFGNLTLDFARADIELAEQRITHHVPEASPSERQYLLLSEYHAQGLAQSKTSFWLSLVFASLGFAVILAAILTMDRNVKLIEQGRTFVTLTAGTIIDAVSALFFVQSNKARQLMTDFFDKLRADRKLEESLTLAGAIPDPILQSRLKILLALNFADVKSTDTLLSSILQSSSQDNQFAECTAEELHPPTVNRIAGHATIREADSTTSRASACPRYKALF